MNKKNRNLLINVLVMVALYVIVSNLPYNEPLTASGIKNLAVLVAAIWGWCTLGPVVPSILGLIAYGMIQGGPMGLPSAFMGAFGAYFISMLLPLLMICGIMMHTGFTKALAMRVVNSKFASGKPWVLIGLLMYASAILSLVLPGIAVIIVIWDVAYSIFDSCGYERGESLPKHMLIGILSAATFGCVCTHLSTGVIPAVGTISAMDPAHPFNPLAFDASSILEMIVFVFLNILLIKFVFRPDVTKLFNYKAPDTKVPFTVDQKIAGVLLVVFVVLVCLPMALPVTSGFRAWLESYGLIGFGFLIVVVALLIRHKDGTPFIEFADIAKAGLSWEIVIMMGAIMCICGGLSLPENGVSDWLVKIMQPLFGGMGPFAAVVVMVILALVVTNILDSAVTSIVFCVLTMAVAGAVGISNWGLQMTVLKAATYGMFLPACSPLLTLLYAKAPDGWIDSKTILKAAWPQIIVAGVVLAVGGYLTLSWF